MQSSDDIMSREAQAAALTPDIMKAYASGELAWSQMRHRLGVTDFGIVLKRLGELDLKLPRAPADRPTPARQWLREALSRQSAAR